jgi:hypothetical protein
MEGLWVRDVMTPDVTTLKRNDKLTLAGDHNANDTLRPTEQAE